MMIITMKNVNFKQLVSLQSAISITIENVGKARGMEMKHWPEMS